MNQLTKSFAAIIVLCVLGCSKKPDSAVEVSQDAAVSRSQFLTQRILVSTRGGDRIVVTRDGRRTEQIALNKSPSQAGVDTAEIFVIATLNPLPDSNDAMLHWTAHIRSVGSEVGGPTESPKLVSAQSLADVFNVSVHEGTHELEETIASITVGDDKYDFVVK